MKGQIGGHKADQIVLALLEHGSMQKTAAALGMSDVTLWRWLRKPESQEAYRKAKREAFSHSIARLQHGAGAAVSTLLRVLVDKDAPAGNPCAGGALHLGARSKCF